MGELRKQSGAAVTDAEIRKKLSAKSGAAVTQAEIKAYRRNMGKPKASKKIKKKKAKASFKTIDELKAFGKEMEKKSGAAVTDAERNAMKRKAIDNLRYEKKIRDEAGAAVPKEEMKAYRERDGR